MSAIEIHDLRDFPQWLSAVAEWHHHEWLQGCGGRAIDSAGALAKRIKLLQEHTDDQLIPRTFLAIAKTDDGEKLPVGSVSIVYYHFTSQSTPGEWLTNLYVDEHYRCAGVGQQLLIHAEQFAATAGIGLLRLYTRDQDSFYSKRNWRFSHQGRVQGSVVSVFDKRLGGVG
ncbi:GNAT family N-acetyltransferase [Teredinibacter waterburyi]|jgi:Acetyltransferase (GNAT) family.|uniref:GNAT family N-acetyltransferase n=1 Tax=Teredinibacter waterburyi TaxID=1500538 RepID=UPI00165FDB2C|nr:GNAT family N-acetyltransferase [Teredinibacter waterburyi]